MTCNKIILSSIVEWQKLWYHFLTPWIPQGTHIWLQWSNVSRKAKLGAGVLSQNVLILCFSYIHPMILIPLGSCCSSPLQQKMHHIPWARHYNWISGGFCLEFVELNVMSIYRRGVQYFVSGSNERLTALGWLNNSPILSLLSPQCTQWQEQ